MQLQCHNSLLWNISLFFSCYITLFHSLSCSVPIFSDLIYPVLSCPVLFNSILFYSTLFYFHLIYFVNRVMRILSLQWREQTLRDRDPSPPPPLPVLLPRVCEVWFLGSGVHFLFNIYTTETIVLFYLFQMLQSLYFYHSYQLWHKFQTLKREKKKEERESEREKDIENARERGRIRGRERKT